MSTNHNHTNHSNDKYIVGGVVVVLVLIGLVAVWIGSFTNSGKTPVATSTEPVATSTAPANVVSLAQCLAEKKITMYGAEWCSHCQAQKAAFGSAWQYIPYVECPDNTNLCLSKGVKGYPTWIKESGEQVSGFQELDKLADWAGCKFN